MTNSIFKSKEHYLAFRAAWAAAVNNKDKTQRPRAEHFVLYNILRGKSYDRGFTPTTNTKKLQNGAVINQGLYYPISCYLRVIKRISEGTKITEDLSKYDALKPFGDTITLEMLKRITIPDVEPLYSNYGKSKQIAEKIIRGILNPVNFADIEAAMGRL